MRFIKCKTPEEFKELMQVYQQLDWSSAYGMSMHGLNNYYGESFPLRYVEVQNNFCVWAYRANKDSAPDMIKQYSVDYSVVRQAFIQNGIEL